MNRSFGGALAGSGESGDFEDLGTPVRVGRLHDARVGPDEQGRIRWIYAVFGQARGYDPFLLVIDPATGGTRQFFPPARRAPRGFKCLFPAADGRVYIGGYNPAGLFRFDPRAPERGIERLGVLPGAVMAWWIRQAADGRFYITTSDQSRLFSWDPEGGRIEDHGRLSDENQYATVLMTSADRRSLYAAVMPERFDVVRYDVGSGHATGLLPPDRRGVGFIGIFRGADDRLEVELPDGVTRVPVSPGPVEGDPSWDSLEDGGRVVSTAAEEIGIERAGATVVLPLRYDAVTEINSAHAAPDGHILAFSHAPLQMCRYHPPTGALEVTGNPFERANGSMRAAANLGGSVVLAAYPSCDLSLYDPQRPWNKGPTPQHNPWTWGLVGAEGHSRPMAVVVAPDGLAYVGSDSAYGVPGGAVACVDPRTGLLLYNIREPFRTLSVQSLSAHAHSLFVGCVSAQPQGAPVIAWDLRERRVRWQVSPVPGASHITSLHAAGGRLFGSTMQNSSYDEQQFFLMDPGSGAVLERRRAPVGAVIDGNLRRGPDGQLYGLTTDGLFFRVDPATLAVQRLARSNRADPYALAITEHAVYFAHGGTLRRLR
ncbi:MAG TPA: PQQ-binding-like beta-propeller repeat protein, partial [Planctomycetaceae bacterium]|nr:PQQ-binding-like beta-propeller repeat protein [Planctomycetaceae bacterium]